MIPSGVADADIVGEYRLGEGILTKIHWQPQYGADQSIFDETAKLVLQFF